MSNDDPLHPHKIKVVESLVVMPDEAVIVSHADRNKYSKFSSGGNYDKEFVTTGSSGDIVKKAHSIGGIFNDDKIFTELDNIGHLDFFDLNGKYVKSLKLDYMARQIIPMPDNKIAVAGWVLWAKRTRDFVAVVDYVTNEQKIIWDHFTDRPEISGEHQMFKYTYLFEQGCGFGFTLIPPETAVGRANTPKIACVNSNLIVANPATGKISVYDLDGNLKSESNVCWSNGSISVDELKEIQQKAIDRLENILRPVSGSRITAEEKERARETLLEEMKTDLENISEPVPLPYFSSMIQDSDGNLLFFDFPEENNANRFNVWILGDTGRFVCQSSFICDDYNLKSIPPGWSFTMDTSMGSRN